MLTFRSTTRNAASKAMKEAKGLGSFFRARCDSTEVVDAAEEAFNVRRRGAVRP